MKATIQNLRRIVKNAGGVLEDDGIQWGVRIYQAVAPTGFHWNASDGYHLLIQWVPGDVMDQRDAFTDAVDRVLEGLRPMTEGERFLADELTPEERVAAEDAAYSAGE